MKKIILLIMSTTLFACINDDQPTPYTHTQSGKEAVINSDTDTILCGAVTDNEVRYNKLVWETRGGGNLYFTVVKKGENFVLERQIMAFKEDFTHYVLTPNAEETKDIYQELWDIYTNPERNKPKPPEPKKDSEHRVLTGSWTVFKVCTDDKKNCYEIERGSQNLYNFVSKLRSNQKMN
ncbi:hypothetical protein [Neisseria sp. Ec49-e6-T10]|uniref:hypothetical protein n=1 Tax=Neisseria sp. Ec49-e6-T10 TaxID=3140744 RepID=UPI003EB92C12